MRVWAFHLAVIAALALAGFVLPEYHHGLVARALVLAAFASAYNLVFGYTGLLSLGHAMYFGAGLYVAGLTIHHLGWPAPVAMLAGVGAGGALALATGALALRTAGVSFMIVTLMFGQVAYLVILYFTTWTRGDEGIPLAQAARTVAGIDLTQPGPRYAAALALFAAVMLTCLAIVRAPMGRVLVAIRENEPRTQMLGYDTFRARLRVMVISGLLAGAAGAAYGVLFGSVSAGLASIQYSILALLWVLLGGAGTVVGPLIGVLVLTYLEDWSGDLFALAAETVPGLGGTALASADNLIVGLVLVLSVLFFRDGLGGALRRRLPGGLP